MLLDRDKRARAVLRLDDVVPVVGQELAQQRAVGRLVVDDEDQSLRALHGSSSSTRAAKVEKSMGLLR